MSGSLGFSDNFLNNLAHPQVLNPLAATQQANQVAQGVWANRQNQANMLAGQAFQNSLNPDGSPNQAKLNQNLQAAGPQGALAAQTASQAGVTNASGNFDLHMKQLTGLSNSMAAVSAQNPNGVPQDVANAAVDREVQGGMITPQIGATFKSQLTADPVQNSRVILQAHMANLSAQDALHASQPNPQQQNIGGSSRTIDTNPITNPGGPGSTGSSVPLTLSPEGGAQRVIVGYDPTTKAPIYGPLSSVTPTAAGAPPGQPQPSAFPNGGRMAPPPGSPLLNPNRPPPPSAAAPPGPPAGTPPPQAGATSATASPAVQAPTPVAAPTPATTGVVSGAPGPAQTAALTASGTQSAQAFADIADQGVKSQGQNAILGNMLADTTQFATGPGTGGTKAFKTAMVGWAPKIAQSFGINVDSVAANESFDKLRAQILTAQGAGSDARMAVGEAGTPSSSLTPAGVDLMLRQLQGNGDFNRARATLASNYPDQSNRAGFENSVGKNLDPRAFQFARMTAPQKVTYVASLSPTDRTTVQNAYNYAHTAGLLGQ